MMLAVESSHLRWHSLPPLWVLVLVIVPAVFLAVRFVYKRESGKLGQRPRMLLGLLRSFAILLVLLALFGPYAETIHGEHFDKHLIVVIDNSGSMDFRDDYQNEDRADEIRQAAGLGPATHPSQRSRLELVQGILRSNRPYLVELADKFSLHFYSFGSSLAPLAQPREGQTPDQAATEILVSVDELVKQEREPITRIGVAIRDLVRSFGARYEPVAGIVMLSDGRHTGGAPSPIEEARRAAQGTRDGIPIYPVEIGDRDAAHNVGVSRIDAPDVVLAGDEVAITVSVHARGYEGRQAHVVAHILSPDGSIRETPPIDAQPFELPRDRNERGERETVEVTFHMRFDTPGSYDLKIGVPKQIGEAVVADNFLRHAILVVKQKVRVLLAAGEPNWEFRFLKELLLRAEETVEANILDFSAEPGAPLLASENVEPIRAFPQTKVALNRYDVVILMDVASRDLGGDAGVEPVLSHLQDWVTEGGGLILQAGKDYIPQAYGATKLMALLPVIPGIAARSTKMLDHEYMRYRLTPAGRKHPILRILEDPVRGHEFWDGFYEHTKYSWYAPTEKAKSTAVLLAERRRWDGDPHAPAQPLIAIQDFGSGKVLWIAVDELWRMRYQVEDLYLWRFWSGAIRHLATYRLLGGNRRFKIFLDRNDGRYRVGDSVEIEAKVLDENFEPLAVREDDPTTQTRTLRLRAPDGSETDVVLTAVPENPPRGIFQARLLAGRPGTYRLLAEPQGDEELAQKSFIVEETSREMRDPLMDREMLQEIARASGGRVLTPLGFLRMLDDEVIKPGAIVRTGERRTTELWDQWWVLLLFTGLLAAEWILRKRSLLL